MKIAHVVCVYSPYKGGIGNVCRSMVKGLRGLGHEVKVFTPNYNGGNIESDGVLRLRTFGKLGNGAFIPSVIFKLKEFDIIHLHYPFFGGVEPVWLFKLLNKKKRLIIHYHMDVFSLGLGVKILSIPSKLISGSLFYLSDAITCASRDYIKNSSIKDIYKDNKNKFFEIPFGVDIERFYPNINRGPNKTKKILFVGGLDRAHYFKGFNILFNALILVGKKRTDWVLQIVGSGDLKKHYEELAKKLEIKERIIFLGDVSDDDLPNVYRDSDFLVLPSINSNEAFGLVLLEAMASGLPVIASSLPGVRSVFSDGKEGFLVAPNNKNDLEDRIIKILENNELAEKMGTAGRRLAEKKYDQRVVIKNLENLYESLYNK